MTEQDSDGGGRRDGDAAADDARAGWRVLEEQQARIAALRAALAAGKLGDAEAPDYETYFAGRRDGEPPAP